MGQVYLENWIPEETGSVLILGHIRPDGDCVGSCLGLYHYLKQTRPSCHVEIALESFDDSFFFLKEARRIRKLEEMDLGQTFELCITCDASDRERLGRGVTLFDRAVHTLCIDHHITNTGFAQKNHIRGGLSSCSEVLGQLMRREAIDQACAECLYLGIIHDTGVFKYSSTTAETMDFAGFLMEKGIDYTYIIDHTYYERTVSQTLICGRAMSKLQMEGDGAIACSTITRADMDACGADTRDLNGIVDQLRIVKGVRVAVFLYETDQGSVKASLRSNDQVDVSRIAAGHGGGGHVKAAGFDEKRPCKEVLQTVLEEIKTQL